MWFFPILFLSLAVLAYHQGHYYMVGVKVAMAVGVSVMNVAWGIPMNLKWLEEERQDKG